MFWRKKEITSAEYADALTKIVKLGNDVQLLRQEVDRISALISSLSGRVNRKLGKVEEEETEGQPIDAATLQRRLLGFGD